MNDELIAIIEDLRDNFLYEDISNYENLLLIIYNSLFLNEDILTSDIKYKIFETISTIIHTIQKQKENNKNKINKEESLILLERLFIPYYLKDKIKCRYRMYKHLENK